MSEHSSLEERLANVEAEIAQLKKQIDSSGSKNWLEAITGSLKDDPTFEAVLAYGREFRYSDRPTDEEANH